MACRSSERLSPPKTGTFITLAVSTTYQSNKKKMEICDSDSTFDHIAITDTGGGFLFYTVNCIVVGYIMGYRVSWFMPDRISSPM